MALKIVRNIEFNTRSMLDIQFDLKSVVSIVFNTGESFSLVITNVIVLNFVIDAEEVEE